MKPGELNQRLLRGLILKMAELKIPIKGNGELDFSKLESHLEAIFCNDPESTYVNLIGDNKSLLKETRDNLQPSFDYKILKIGKIGNNYLIKVGVRI